jgi:hypothetical protein
VNVCPFRTVGHVSNLGLNLEKCEEYLTIATSVPKASYKEDMMRDKD